MLGRSSSAKVPARVSRYILYAAAGCGVLLLATGLAGSSSASAPTPVEAFNRCMESHDPSFPPIELPASRTSTGSGKYQSIAFSVAGIGNQQLAAALEACLQQAEALVPATSAGQTSSGGSSGPGSSRTYLWKVSSAGQ